MSKTVSHLEDLPNELIADIYKYLDARQVFHSFYSLNTRFKKLFLSSDYLHLTMSLFDSNDNKHDEMILHCIRTLIIDRGINLSFKKFPKLRYLFLRNPKEKIFEQLNRQFIPSIEYISITHRFNTITTQSLINDLYRRIFSNHFSHLKSCDLSNTEVQLPSESWRQSTSLNLLKVGKTNPIIYKAILSSCPNLYFIQLTNSPLLQSTLPNMIFHLQLRQLTIKDDDSSSSWNDHHINEYLQCVPNLEKFTIYRINSFRKITNFSNYDWLASILMHSLQLLQKFQFILEVYDKNRYTKCFRENMFSALKEHFSNVHKYHYQAQIRIMELLPNEILMDIFRYFNAQELFRIFYEFNHRFQTLVQSFQQLKLCFSVKQNNQNLLRNNDRFLSFVYSLHVHAGVKIDFRLFSNVRCLKLDWPSNEELQQLCSNVLPHLEQLTLANIETFPSNDGSISLPSLRILQVRHINLNIYQTILSSCPNLQYFELAMFTSEESPLYIEPHKSLRKLVIHIGDVLWPWNDRIFDKYFICTPNLEQLSLHRVGYIGRITKTFHDYDWLAGIITKYLQQLRQFHFHLRSSPSKYLNKTETKRILDQIKEDFCKAHHSHYQSRLIINHY